MHKIAVFACSLALAPMPSPASPAAVPGGLPTTKLSVRAVDLQKIKLPPLLSRAQLGDAVIAAGKTKKKPKEGPSFESVIELSPHHAREGGAFMSYFCPALFVGIPDTPMLWEGTATRLCGERSLLVGATIEFPVEAGRVYVVNCQASGNTWVLSRWSGIAPVGGVERTRSENPTFVVAATENRTEIVAFGLQDAEDFITNYSLGRCQIGKLAV